MCLCASAFAQPARFSFDSPAIRLSSGAGKTISISNAHGLVIKNASLRGLAAVAYQVRDSQIEGGPPWADKAQFEVDAQRHGTPPASQSEWRDAVSGMLQSLLKDRLHLSIHRTTNDLPVYALVLAKGGARLRHSASQNCPVFVWSRNSIPPEKRWAPDYCGALDTGPNERLNHTLDAVAMSISNARNSLTAFLSQQLDRTVIDRSGLSGLFDVRLEWSWPATKKEIAAGTPQSPGLLIDDNPSLFSAVEEQLGLRLEATTGPVEIVMIDRAEMPSTN